MLGLCCEKTSRIKRQGFPVRSLDGKTEMRLILVMAEEEADGMPARLEVDSSRGGSGDRCFLFRDDAAVVDEEGGHSHGG